LPKKKKYLKRNLGRGGGLTGAKLEKKEEKPLPGKKKKLVDFDKN